MLNASTKYEQVEANSLDQGTLIIMAYEGAIGFIKVAKEKLAQNDYAGKSINISNAVAIINELNSRLNMEAGGETAKNLNKLYTFLSFHLTTANLKRDAHKLDESISILENLLNGWRIIIEKDRQQKSSVLPSGDAVSGQSFEGGHSTATSVTA